jgi:predicted metal-dependent phosphoesterase TrpH
MIDLHVHSTASDGTLTPTELAERGRAFSVMALTDHDNCDGVEEFLSAAETQGVVRLAGVELSVEPGEGYERFHLLGLGIDPADEALAGFLRRVQGGRGERNARMLERFAAIGINISPHELSAYAKGEVTARPHFARWLVDHGYAASVAEAFDRYLTQSSPAETNCYSSRYRPEPGEAFDVIHRAGGVAVMAHPRQWTNDPAMLRAGLERLKDRGLDGIEAVYQANSPDETVDHLRAAKELGLCVTAGSDFHGANKAMVTLGMAVDDEEEFLAPFFARLEHWRGTARR